MLKDKTQGWGHTLVVKHLPIMCKALGLISSKNKLKHIKILKEFGQQFMHWGTLICMWFQDPMKGQEGKARRKRWINRLIWIIPVERS